MSNVYYINKYAKIKLPTNEMMIRFLQLLNIRYDVKLSFFVQFNFDCKHSTMHILCIGCDKSFVGINKTELNKLMKEHWDIQNQYFDKCLYCKIILHGDSNDLVKIRLVEHKKICEKAIQHDSNQIDYYERCLRTHLYKKVCQGCGDIFIGDNEERLNKMFWKVHWDDQNPFLEKCECCSIIFHAETQDFVNKRLLEHEKFCEKNNHHN